MKYLVVYNGHFPGAWNVACVEAESADEAIRKTYMNFGFYYHAFPACKRDITAIPVDELQDGWFFNTDPISNGYSECRGAGGTGGAAHPDPDQKETP
jgi:hypothetical protein